MPDAATDGPIEVTVGEETATGPDFDVITYGALEAEVATSGDSKDEDGYILEVDGKSRESAVDNTFYFNYLEEGSYEVELTGIADNCATDGENPALFDITAGDTTTVAMEVICESAGAVLKDKIVFVSDQVDYREEIFTVNPEGSDFTQLTFGSERDKWIPSVSPDGSKIAYVSGEEIFIMNADGSDVTLFPHEGSHPSWSPDGNQLLISSDRDGNVEIYKINVDGSGPVINLTANSAEDTIPNWSPVE